MSLTIIILLVLTLYGVQLFLQETTRYNFNLTGIVGNRDHPDEPSIVAARLDRAKCNMQEALPIFIAVALLTMIKGVENDAVNGAWIFFIARLADVPAYVSGVPWIRSILWLISNAGLLMMAIVLFSWQRM